MLETPPTEATILVYVRLDFQLRNGLQPAVRLMLQTLLLGATGTSNVASVGGVSSINTGHSAMVPNSNVCNMTAN